jgi:hypothetical protein
MYGHSWSGSLGRAPQTDRENPRRLSSRHLQTPEDRRRQAALHGVSAATRLQTKCPQPHCASIHRLIQWRATERFGAQRRRRRQRCFEDCIYGSDRLEDWDFRDCECAETAHVGARRPCTALLGHRVRKWNARNLIARPITA